MSNGGPLTECGAKEREQNKHKKSTRYGGRTRVAAVKGPYANHCTNLEEGGGKGVEQWWSADGVRGKRKGRGGAGKSTHWVKACASSS